MREMIRKMGFVGGLLLTLAFAAPAFESHACADELSPLTAEASIDVPADPDIQCPDCGPACGNGCCHAPHAATAPDVAVIKAAPTFASPCLWSHIVGRPLDAPGGPERPPRP